MSRNLTDRLRAEVDPLDRIPPSAQSQRNIRIVNAAHEVAASHDNLVSALKSAYRLLQDDDTTGALAHLPAGGAQCEELVQQAVAIIRIALASIKEPGK